MIASILIHVLTLNIWGLPDIAFKVLSPLREERVVKICELFKKSSVQENGWDVILLQEVWRAEDRATLKKCGYSFSYEREEKRLLDSGLMILSRHEISEGHRLTFRPLASETNPLESGETFARKGGLAVRIRYTESDREFWVASTHLISQYEYPDHYEKDREAQLNLFSKWSLSFVGFKDGLVKLPLIVGGDFNFTKKSALWKRVGEFFPGFSDAKQSDFACTICPPNVMHDRNEGKVDHLLVSAGSKAISGAIAADKEFVIDGTRVNLSDHFGWQTTFELKY